MTDIKVLLVEDEEVPAAVPLSARVDPDEAELTPRNAAAEVEEVAIAAGVQPKLTRSDKRHVLVESRPREGTAEVDQFFRLSENLVVHLRPLLDRLLTHLLSEVHDSARDDPLPFPGVGELLVGRVVGRPRQDVGVLHGGLRGDGLVIVGLPPVRSSGEIEGRSQRSSDCVDEPIDTSLQLLLAGVSDEGMDLLVTHATSEKPV